MGGGVRSTREAAIIRQNFSPYLHLHSAQSLLDIVSRDSGGRERGERKTEEKTNKQKDKERVRAAEETALHTHFHSLILFFISPDASRGNALL